MFQIGDLLVYGSTGICRVEDLCRPNLTGKDRETLYYQLNPLYQDGLIYAPVENCKVVMRAPLSIQEARDLLALIPSLQPEIYRAPTTQALTQYYQAILRSHDCEKLAHMVLSIHAKRQQAAAQTRRLGLVDERYLKQAERLLCGELSAVLQMDFEEVQSLLARHACEAQPASV